MKSFDAVLDAIQACNGPLEAKTLLRKLYIKKRATKFLSSYFVKPRIIVSGDDSNGFFLSIYSTRLKPSLLTYISAVSDAFPDAIPFVDCNPLSNDRELEFWFSVPVKCYSHVR